MGLRETCGREYSLRGEEFVCYLAGVCRDVQFNGRQAGRERVLCPERYGTGSRFVSGWHKRLRVAQETRRQCLPLKDSHAFADETKMPDQSLMFLVSLTR